MLDQSLKFQDIGFDSQVQEKDSFLAVTIKVLLLSEKFIKSILTEDYNCRHPGNDCIMSCLYTALYQGSKRKLISLGPLRKALAITYKESEKYSIDDLDVDITEAMISIMTAVHVKALAIPCNTIDEEIINSSCRGKCSFHSNFYLGVEENQICKCGNESVYMWEYMSMFQFFNASEIFEDVEQDKSKVLIKVPEFVIKRDKFIGNAVRLKNKIGLCLKEKLTNAEGNSCSNEDCEIQNPKIGFNLVICPENFIINLIWENSDRKYLFVIQAIAAINSTLMLNEIYGKGPETRYNLTGIVFQKKSLYEYAHRNGDVWNFTGIHENAGWFELLQEVTLLRYIPVCLIYGKADIKKPYNFKIKDYKLTYIEKLACQCEEYEANYGVTIFNNEQIITGLISKPKKKFLNYKQENLQEAEKKILENTTKNREERKLVNDEIVFLEKNNEKIGRNKGILTEETLYKAKENNSEITWKCICGYENNKSWELCNSCFKLKPGVKGWVCKGCKVINMPDSFMCKVCGHKDEHFGNKILKEKEEIDDIYKTKDNFKGKAINFEKKIDKGGLEREQKERENAEIERRRFEREQKERENAEIERRRLEREQKERENAEIERRRLEIEQKEKENAEIERRRLEREQKEKENAEIERRRLEREQKARENAEIERRRLEREQKVRENAEIERRRFEREQKERENAEIERRRLEREQKERENAEIERRRLEREQKEKENAEIERRRLEREQKARENAEIERRRLEREQKERENAEIERRRLEREQKKRENDEIERKRLEKGQKRRENIEIEKKEIENAEYERKKPELEKFRPFRNERENAENERRRPEKQQDENQIIPSERKRLEYEQKLRNQRNSSDISQKSPSNFTSQASPPNRKEVIKIWDCECGSSNADEWEVCQKCERIKPGLKGWVCRLCKVRNPSERKTRCIGCDNYRDSDAAQGQDYWSCRKCKTANSVLIDICEECDTPNESFEKPKIDIRYDDLKSRMWTCKKCNSSNSILIDNCIKCKHPNSYLTPKREQKIEREYQEENGWKCACGKINLSKSHMCVSCFEDKKKSFENVEVTREKRDMPQRILISNKRITEEPYLNEFEERRDNPKKSLVAAYSTQEKEERRDNSKKSLVSAYSTQEKEERKLKVDQKTSAWKCTNCYITNEGYKTYCSSCYRGKTDEKRQQFYENLTWTCFRCNSKNILDSCTNCKTTKSASEKLSRNNYIKTEAIKCCICLKESKIINCPQCKKPIRVGETCNYCSAVIVGVKKCSSCEDEEKERLASKTNQSSNIKYSHYPNSKKYF